jgi:hypothetical protein
MMKHSLLLQVGNHDRANGAFSSPDGVAYASTRASGAASGPAWRIEGIDGRQG